MTMIQWTLITSKVISVSCYVSQKKTLHSLRSRSYPIAVIRCCQCGQNRSQQKWNFGPCPCKHVSTGVCRRLGDKMEQWLRKWISMENCRWYLIRGNTRWPQSPAWHFPVLVSIWSRRIWGRLTYSCFLWESKSVGSTLQRQTFPGRSLFHVSSLWCITETSTMHHCCFADIKAVLLTTSTCHSIFDTYWLWDCVLRYCRNVRPTWVKFNSKDTKESEWCSRFWVLSPRRGLR